MLDPTFHITTPRLHLSYLDPSNDAHMTFFMNLHSSPEYLAVAAQSGATPSPLKSIEDARAALQARTQRLGAAGNGRYIISLRGGDGSVPFPTNQHNDPQIENEKAGEKEYIGYVSMKQTRFPTLPCPLIPDLGFILLAAYYGQGYASEACEALMQYFREEKGEQRFAGFTHPENMQSQKLFRRLGFEDRGVSEVAGIVGDGKPVRAAVWVKGVKGDVGLGELGIGSGIGKGEEGEWGVEVSRLEKIEKSVV